MRSGSADHVAAFEQITNRFVTWASSESHIRAAMVIGSRARTDHPADEWSDLDIIVFTTDPSLLLDSDRWLGRIGEPIITYLEPTAVGAWKERRVLFEGARDVDFAVVPADLATILASIDDADPPLIDVASVVGKGYRILLDKDQRLATIMQRLASTMPPALRPPGQMEFTETLNDFWYHCFWIAKKLRRGEPIVAHECLDGNQRRLLMRLIRWHAHQNGAVWHKTRFMEEWAHPHIAQRLPSTWAHHNAADITRALREMMGLVAWLAADIADANMLEAATSSETAVRTWFSGMSNA